MISNHYPLLTDSPINWLLLAGMGLAGWTIRHFFNLKNSGRTDYTVLIYGMMIFAAVAVLAEAAKPRSAAAAMGPVSFSQVQAIVHTHCSMCHADQPTHKGFTAPPNGLSFDNPDRIRAAAPKIYERAVASESMPLGNETHITRAERDTLGAWVQQGAKP